MAYVTNRNDAIFTPVLWVRLRFTFLLLALFVLNLAVGATPVQANSAQAKSEPQTLHVGVMSDWAPMSFVQFGKVQGVSVDYLQALMAPSNGDSKYQIEWVIGQWSDLLAQMRNGELDLLLDATNLPSRQNDMLFTQPYLSIPHVIITHHSQSITDVSQLNGKTLALERAYGNVEFFWKNYPQVLIRQYADTASALEAVAIGEAQAYAGNRASAIHQINQQLIRNLRIQTSLPQQQSVLSFAVRKDFPALRDFLDKKLSAMTQQEHQAIQQKWVGLHLFDTQGLQTSVFWRNVFGVSIFGLVLVLLWNWRLKRHLRSVRRAMHRLTNYDAQTGVSNAKMFQSKLQETIDRHNSGNILVLFLRLKDLPEVAKLQGEDSLDHLLLQTTSYLYARAQVQEVGRISSSVFAIFTQPLASEVAVENLSKHYVKHLLSKKEAYLPAGVGAYLAGAVFPRDGLDAKTLIDSTMLALSNAERIGSNHLTLFNSVLNTRFERRFLLNQAMLQAPVDSQFEVFYQPKVNIASGEIDSFEALLRWFHPELGSVSPDEFIEIAEENEKILLLGEFVLQQAIEQCIQWQAVCHRPVKVAVNLSPVQLQDEHLVLKIKRLLLKYPLSPDQLEIEVTEGVLLSKSESDLNKLMQLKALGIHLAMDDFGKGYSSLSYLQRYPFDVIKIDKEFISSIDSGDNQKQLVLSILALTKSLGLESVAEGVETLEQLQFLANNGCDIAQGYYFSRPVNQAQALELLRAAKI